MLCFRLGGRRVKGEEPLTSALLVTYEEHQELDPSGYIIPTPTD